MNLDMLNTRMSHAVISLYIICKYIFINLIFEVGESKFFLKNKGNSDFKYTYTCINIPVKYAGIVTHFKELKFVSRCIFYHINYLCWQ